MLRHEATLKPIGEAGGCHLGRLKLLIKQGAQAIKLAGLAEIRSADNFIEGRAVGLIVNVDEDAALLVLRFRRGVFPVPIALGGVLEGIRIHFLEAAIAVVELVGVAVVFEGHILGLELCAPFALLIHGVAFAVLVSAVRRRFQLRAKTQIGNKVPGQIGEAGLVIALGNQGLKVPLGEIKHPIPPGRHHRLRLRGKGATGHAFPQHEPHGEAKRGFASGLRGVQGRADAVLPEASIDIVRGPGIAIDAQGQIAGFLHRIEELHGHALGRALGAVEGFVMVSQA